MLTVTANSRRRSKNNVICWLSDFSAEYPGSFIDALVALARYCRDKMHVETFCIFPDTAIDKVWLRQLDAEKIRYGLVSRKVNVVGQIRALLCDDEPLLFHTHFFFYDLSSILLKVRFYKHAKIVWHYHNPTGSTLMQRVKNAVKLQIIARCLNDRCIAVGDGVYQSLIKAGFPSDKLTLIYNGINTQRYTANERERGRVRKALGAEDGQTVFLMLGMDPVRKGVDIFIKAAAEVVKESRANCLFIVVGRKPTRDFASTIGESAVLGHSLRVLDPSSEFSSTLNGIDVLVSCSRSEAFSYAIAEAMAAEKHILCSEVPGMREIYGNAPGVCFFPSEDPSALADLMQRANSEAAADRKALSQANREYIVRKYSLDTWAAKMGEVYGSVLGKLEREEHG